MKCSVCSCEVPEGCKFCIHCGSPIQPAPAPSVSASHCAHCGNALIPGSQFCQVCGTMVGSTYVSPVASEASNPVYIPPVAVDTPAAACVPPVTPAKKPKKSSKFPVKKLLIILGAVLVLAAVAFLAYKLLTGGFADPATQLRDAAQKTVESGSFTFAVDVDGTEITGEVDADFKKKELTIVLRENGKITNFIYEGYSYYYDSWDERWVGGGSPAAVEEIFEVYETYDELKDANLKEILDELGILEDVEDVMDIKELEKAIDRITDKSWLEEYAGYTTETEDGEKLHIFDINGYKLLTGLLDTLEDAFEDRDDYKDAKEELRAEKDSYKDVKMKITIGVKDDYISFAEVKVDGEKVRIKFSDVGKTRIDTDELEELAKDAYVYQYDDDYIYDDNYIYDYS